jgi:hypothetical protein
LSVNFGSVADSIIKGEDASSNGSIKMPFRESIEFYGKGGIFQKLDEGYGVIHIT